MLNYPNFWNKKTFISYLFSPLTLLFKFGSFLRKISSKTVKLPGKVICVGNITVGGTGKTPIIKELAKKFSEQQVKIVIISKGYNSLLKKPKLVSESDSAIEVSDEAIEIFNSLKTINNISVIASKNPPDSLNILNSLKPDIILVDDGMQNPSFQKDCIIAVVDGIRGFGNGMVIPSGPLREEIIPGLEKSKIIVSLNPLLDLENSLSKTNKFIPLNSFIELDEEVKNKKILLVCGIGNPQKFFELFDDKSIKLSFPDHINYDKDNIDTINHLAKKYKCEYIVTTEKDYFKLKNFNFLCPLKLAKLKISDKDIKKLIDQI